MISDNLSNSSIKLLCDKMAGMEVTLEQLLAGQKKLLAYHNLTNRNQSLDLSLPLTIWQKAVELNEKINADAPYGIRMVCFSLSIHVLCLF